MDPWGVFCEFFYEPGAGDGAAAFAGAGVADVGDIAFDHFLVFVVDGHGPHFFADRFGAFEKLIEIFARSAEGADVDVGERDLDGVGLGGGADQMGGAEFAGVEDAVGQDHAAFRVGIDDFDGFAGHGDLDVAGFLSAAAGHVFRGGDHGDHRDCGLEVGDGAHGAEHGGAAAHVVLHFFHVVGGFDGDAAGVEGDGFADEAEDWSVGAGVFGRVTDDDYAGRFDAALRDTDKGSHFQLGDFSFVEDFDAQADFLGHGFGASCEHARGEAVRGLVDQIAREILRLGDDAAVFDGFGEIAVLIGVETGEENRLNLFAGFLFGLIFIGFEIGDAEAFGDGLCGGGAAFAFAGEENKFFHAAGFQVTQRGAGDFAQVGLREFFGLAGADKEEALGVEAFGEMNENGLEGLAGELAGGDESGEAAVHGVVNVGQDSIKFVFFVEDVGDEGVGLNRSVRLIFELNLHVFLSLLAAARAIHRFAGFAFSFFLFFGFAAVVEFLALRHGQFTFGDAVPEIDFGGDDGHAFLLGLDEQPVNLTAVE